METTGNYCYVMRTADDVRKAFSTSVDLFVGRNIAASTAWGTASDTKRYFKIASCSQTAFQNRCFEKLVTTCFDSLYRFLVLYNIVFLQFWIFY